MNTFLFVRYAFSWRWWFWYCFGLSRRVNCLVEANDSEMGAAPFFSPEDGDSRTWRLNLKEYNHKVWVGDRFTALVRVNGHWAPLNLKEPAFRSNTCMSESQRLPDDTKSAFKKCSTLAYQVYLMVARNAVSIALCIETHLFNCVNDLISSQQHSTY
jgi:hypothetical protein